MEYQWRRNTHFARQQSNQVSSDNALRVSLNVFVILSVILGFMMSLGKAAVYKHIPHYYPEHVGSVGGLVGMIGGLGGFILPITFGILPDTTGIWTAPFMQLSDQQKESAKLKTAIDG